ncbi:MAG: LamG domain-containing protein, partial [Candidatus Paceibacterota bacterium]
HANTTSISSGLVGYWPLDGSTINWKTGTVSDMSGQGNNGSPVSLGTTTSVVAGKIGQALKFNGTTSYVASGTNLGLSGDFSGTISAWVKRTSGSGFRSVFVAGSAVSMESFGLGINSNSDGDFNIQFNGGHARYSAGSLVPLNTWTYLAVTKTPGPIETTSHLYINGVEVAQAGGQTGTPNFVANLAYIGTWTNLSSYFPGSIDDVRVYNRALSTTEIAQLYNTGSTNVAHSNATPGIGLNSGLVGHWTFDGPNINWKTGTIVDSSGQGNNGTPVSLGTTTSPTIGKIGQALKFNGSTYIDTLDDAAANGTGPLHFADTDTFSLSLWYKGTDTEQNGSFGKTLLGRSSGDIYANFILRSGKVGYLHYNNAWLNNIESTTNVADGRWHHVTYVNHSNETGDLYVDGAAEITGSSSSISAAAYKFTISSFMFGYSAKYTSGTVDDVRIYNRALSVTEVQQLYKMGK